MASVITLSAGLSIRRKNHTSSVFALSSDVRDSGESDRARSSDPARPRRELLRTSGRPWRISSARSGNASLKDRCGSSGVPHVPWPESDASSELPLPLPGMGPPPPPSASSEVRVSDRRRASASGTSRPKATCSELRRARVIRGDRPPGSASDGGDPDEYTPGLLGSGGDAAPSPCDDRSRVSAAAASTGRRIASRRSDSDLPRR
mmetsp:Transcript_31914/g.83624  ORF Transcript_31914/g.83624 Transcript_31914/m.83624 type:complete len:205 (-) Transcript_31914:650-1264(-)